MEKIVRELEAGDLPLERSLELFERGVGLSEQCRKQLEEAETRVESLIRRGNKTTAEPFQPPNKLTHESPGVSPHPAGTHRPASRPPGPRRVGSARNHPSRHALQPVRRRQTHPADSLPGSRALRCGDLVTAAPRRCRLLARIHPHLLADSRRSSRARQRRLPPRQADQPQSLRRSHGDPGRRRPADPRLRSARQAARIRPPSSARA